MGYRRVAVLAVGFSTIVLEACGSSGAATAGRPADRPGVRAVDSIAHDVALNMGSKKNYLDENLKPDTSATGLARVASARGEVLKASGDVYGPSGGVVVARFSAIYDDPTTGDERTIVQCRRFTVTRAWFQVDTKGVDCPSG